MTKNITIRDIIYSRIDFIENNNIFDKKEYMYVNKGEIEAYSEILTDIELLTIDAFVRLKHKITVYAATDQIAV